MNNKKKKLKNLNKNYQKRNQKILNKISTFQQQDENFQVSNTSKKEGIDVNKKADKNFDAGIAIDSTALHVASRIGRLPIVQYLIEKGDH